MTHSTTFAQIIRQCRVRAGLTIEDLSEASGVSVRTISNIERGVSQLPHRRNLIALAEASGADDGERADLDDALRARRRLVAHPDGNATVTQSPGTRSTLVVVDMRGFELDVPDGSSALRHMLAGLAGSLTEVSFLPEGQGQRYIERLEQAPHVIVVDRAASHDDNPARLTFESLWSNRA